MYDWITFTLFKELGEMVTVTDLDVNHHGLLRHKNRLSVFDEFIGDMIIQGYHVESMGVNPQVRSAWNSYCIQILIREHRSRSNGKSDSVDSQTDRHEEDVATEFNLPTVINADD